DRVEEPRSGARTVGGLDADDADRARQVDQPTDLEPDGVVERAESSGSAGHRETGSEDLDDRPVRDGSLPRISPRAEDDPTVRTDDVGDRLGQARLADPGLSFENRDPAIGGRGPPRRLGRCPLAGPSEAR